MRVASAHMADAIREITVERGLDPRDGALMAFGGAGGLFATLLARESEVPTIVIPPFSGNFSAWGLLGADVTQTTAQTMLAPLADESTGEAGKVLARLLAELRERPGGGENGASPRGGARPSLPGPGIQPHGRGPRRRGGDQRRQRRNRLGLRAGVREDLRPPDAGADRDRRGAGNAAHLDAGASPPARARRRRRSGGRRAARLLVHGGRRGRSSRCSSASRWRSAPSSPARP